MLSESEIKSQVISYRFGEQSFEDFEDWLAEHTRENYLDNPSKVRNLVGQIKLLIVDTLDDRLSEEAFKEELYNLAMKSYSELEISLTGGVVIVPKFTSSSARPELILARI